MEYDACIVRPHYSGLWSLINKVITCMDKYKKVHVDWSSYCIYGDCWNDLFYPTEPVTGEHDILMFYPNLKITGTEVAELYKSGDEWRSHYHELWKKLKVRESITAEVDDFCKANFSTHVVAGMIRDHTHRNEQVPPRSQSLEEYARVFDLVKKPETKFFIMCRDNESLAWFASRFPIITYPHTKRCANRDMNLHLMEPQTSQDAKHCLIEILICARANEFVHPVSNMATAVLYINPIVKSHYLP